MNNLTTKDILVFVTYFLIVALYGYWIYRRKKNTTGSVKDFFLAEGSLTWWAIGASLIASNISAEQFVAMSGSGFALGLGIASYEWIAAASLIIIAIFFLPVYLRNKIYTMPQFLRERYDERVSTIMAIFWLFLYVFVNLTSIVYLGALSISTMTGFSFLACSIGLSVFAIFITLGGMRVIGYTDVIQVFFLVLGGLATTYLVLNLVSDKLGTGSGFMEGLSLLKQKAPDHFHMMFAKGQMKFHNGSGGMGDAWNELPAMATILFGIGGMWIANLNYWGCNQYITQRALGADLKTARSGLIFAGFLKLLMPVIVVLPGIACYVIYNNNADANIVSGLTENGIIKPDNAYPVLLNLLPAGLKGLAFAALTAAIVASLAGKANSISTIFSLDVYKRFINKDADDKKMVRTGKIVILIAFILAVTIAPALKSFGQGFKYIQEYTGFISPGIFSIFILGFFWKRATANAALAVTILSIPLSLLLKWQMPELPFLHRMMWVFLSCITVMVVISLLSKPSTAEKKIKVEKEWFKTSMGLNIAMVIILGILAALYLVFW